MMASESTEMSSGATQVESNSTRNWLVMAAVGVGSLLGSLDSSVVNIALPTIRRSFGTEVATAEWVVAIYLLMVCGFLLSFGRIGDMHGQKPVYVCGFAAFVASSALCGLAPSIAMLILFRAVQGMGGAMIFTSGAAILTQTFPPSQRGRVLGLQVLMVYLGGMTGPSLGGWLTDRFTWRAVFYVNVPVGLIALVLSAKFIPWVKPASKHERFDFPGAALFLATFSLLLIALNQGHTYGWTSSYIVRMFAAAALLLAVFVLVESRTRSPLLDLGLFRAPTFSLCATSAICNYMAMFSIAFLMPFYLIQGHGLSSSSAGLLMTVQPLVMVISAPAAGAISDRVGTRGPAMLGMALVAVAMYLLSRLGPTSSLVYIGAAIGTAGLGAGCFVAPNSSTLMGSAPKNRLGIAAAVLATARFIGMILGVGVSGAIFTTLIRAHTQAAFFSGIQISFLVASAVSCVGCITSAARN
jgi:EmrB/QacA subfamily drug resistance transporter